MSHKYTELKNRHILRGLRHKLEGTQEEIEKYEAEIQSHLRDDVEDHIAAQAAKKASEKKDGLEGLGSK